MTAKIRQTKAKNVMLHLKLAIFEHKDDRLQGFAG